MEQYQLTVSNTIRKCQRNWDLSRKIPNEHIEQLITIAKNAPSTQDEGFFDLVVIKSRNMINQIHDRSIGYLMHDTNAKPIPSWKNPQTAANILFIWCKKIPPTIREFYQNDPGHCNPNPTEIHGSRKRQQDDSRLLENSLTSIGISLGVTAWAAAELGYTTGFCKCLGDHNDLKKLLNIKKEADPMYALGVGFPDNELPHNISHEGNMYNHHSCIEKRVNIHII